MSTISGIACDLMRGVPKYNTERIRKWETPGIDGFGAMSMGLGNGESTLTLIKYGSNAVVEAWAVSVEALPGSQPVTIVDDHGDTHVNFLVITVSNREKTTASYAKLGVTDLRCELAVTILKV